MSIEWKHPRGFSSRRVAACAEVDGVKLRVDIGERFSCFVDGQFKGTAFSLENAKLACVLELDHRIALNRKAQ